MSKAERGTKRACSGCGTKFYDLNKDPIVCPVCETVFVTRETPTRAKAATPAPAAKKPVEEDEEAEPKATGAGPEIISLSDVEAEESDDDADIDLGDDDADIPDTDDDDDTFLEDDDEEGSNVTDIIPGSVKSEDEP